LIFFTLAPRLSPCGMREPILHNLFMEIGEMPACYSFAKMNGWLRGQGEG
jgi:hypothetical protein